LLAAKPSPTPSRLREGRVTPVLRAATAEQVKAADQHRDQQDDGDRHRPADAAVTSAAKSVGDTAKKAGDAISPDAK
jgi:hypothetical protein